MIGSLSLVKICIRDSSPLHSVIPCPKTGRHEEIFIWFEFAAPMAPRLAGMIPEDPWALAKNEEVYNAWTDVFAVSEGWIWGEKAKHGDQRHQ